jgi:hypothetical protein
MLVNDMAKANVDKTNRAVVMPQHLLFVSLSLLLLPSNTKFPTPSPLIRDLILIRRPHAAEHATPHTPPFSFPPEVLIALLHNFLPVGNAYFNSLHSHWNAAWRECRSGSTCNVRNVDEDVQNAGFESLH